MSRKYTSSAKYDWQQAIRPGVAPLTVAVTSALAAGSLQAATITVSTLDDGLIAGECSLRSALYSASMNVSSNACTAGEVGADTIVFESSLSGTIQLVGDFTYGFDGSTLPIGESVTINGDDRITVRGTGQGQVFYAKYDDDPGLNAKSVTFENLTIANGFSFDFGGAIYSRSDDLTLSNVTVSGNTAMVGGAAVFHSPYQTGLISGGKNLHISESTIQFNFAYLPTTGGSGGAVWADMGDYATIGIYDSNFTSNTSQGQGGAIYARINDYAYMTISNSQFYNNHADDTEGHGGAVFAELRYAIVDIFDNTFTGNTTYGDGGAVFIREELSVFQRAEISLAGNQFIDNQAENNGGAAFITVANGSDGTITDPVKFIELFGNNYFHGNETGLSAGALFIAAYDTVPTTITGAEFSANTAQSHGGAVYIYATDQAPVTFNQVDFKLNETIQGSGSGALVTVGNGGLNLDGVNFESNGTFGGGQGGGLLVNAINGDVLGQDVQFIGNFAEISGGAEISSVDGDIGFQRSRFVDNTAMAGRGGGLTILGSPGQVGMSQSVVSGNDSLWGGGGLYVNISSQSAPLEIKYSEFSDNSTGVSGGGVLIGTGQNSQLFMKNSTLSGNSAQSGGALYVYNPMSLQVKYSTIADNHASFDGGGIYSNLANGCSIENSILAGNTIEPENNPQELNGGDYLCDINYSLIAAANYSDYNNGTGNIVNQDALLMPLDDNGGTGGRTHALQPGSPAIDAGNAGASPPPTDQRGSPFVRIFGSEVDMGAYERQDFPDAVFSDRFEESP